MRKVTIMLTLMGIMVNLSGQGGECSLPVSAGSGNDMIILSYHPQFIPDIESITFFSDGQVRCVTYFNRMREESRHRILKSLAGPVALLLGFAFDGSFTRRIDEKEIIIPLKIAGERLYSFPEHRLIIAFTDRILHLPRIKPVFIKESGLSVWLKITI